MCGIGIGYAAFGEDIIDKVFQVFGFVFKDKHDPSTILPSLLGVVTAIAGAQGLTKGAQRWIDYKREKDCGGNPLECAARKQKQETKE